MSAPFTSSLMSAQGHGTAGMAGGFDAEDEWLESDSLGGFASGTVGGERTRRYHALLLTASTPPTGRLVLVSGCEVWLETAHGSTALSTQRYTPDVLYPDARLRIGGFEPAPWPTWRFRLDDGASVVFELFVARDACETVMRWRLERPGRTPRAANAVEAATSDPDAAATLHVRPLLCGRDYHALHHENPVFDFAYRAAGGNVTWRPYGSLPAIGALSNGSYAHEPQWYRHFCYRRERERGLDWEEDLASPGRFSFALHERPAVLILRAGDGLALEPTAYAGSLAALERERRAALYTVPAATGGVHAGRTDRAPGPARPADGPDPAPPQPRLRALAQRSADAYFVARGQGRSVLAGFPWFTDWGRDTFISLRGLALATSRFADAESILLEWSETISQGMLPNRFPDAGGEPEYNAVDASLWFVIAVHDYLATGHAGPATLARLRQAVEAVLEGYERGTRFNIGAGADGLLRAGQPGVQLTWMDARIGERVVTPRIGKPVEVQALWINALRCAAQWTPRWQALERRASDAFAVRFIDPVQGGLYDVIDVDHEPGRIDAKIRPNQIFAIGGLPFALLDGTAARAVLAQVETHLLTPLGLRTLAPGDPDYVGRYAGGPQARDAAYHQGTAWPWLLGPFVDAWLRVNSTVDGKIDAGRASASRAEARERFLAPLAAHLGTAGLGHVCEVADGDAPHTPAGAPFQAWSLGELLRIEQWLDQ